MELEEEGQSLTCHGCPTGMQKIDVEIVVDDDFDSSIDDLAESLFTIPVHEETKTI